MKILFIHQNFPGQYKHLARVMAADPANDVRFLCNPKPIAIPNVRKIDIRYERKKASTAHAYLQDFEEAVYRAQAAGRSLLELRRSGFRPDVICAHPGWGDALFVKDIFPESPLLNYCEFYYQPFGADVHFDPRQKPEINTVARVRVKNANNILNLAACDWGISPTHWQHERHPEEFQKKISVLHEGVDTDLLTPQKMTDALKLPNGVTIRPDEEIVTYLARNLEPYRGFPSFMRAVSLLQKLRPQCRVIIVGNDGASYSKPPQGKTFKELVLREVSYDASRVDFVGYLPYDAMVKLLRYSKAHVYLTVPFVLSWSMLEAMSVGALIIGSDTPPVREIITDGKNGLLVDFFSPEKIAERIAQALVHQNELTEVRRNARQTILERYALKDTLPLQVALLKDLAAGKIPPPTHQKITERLHQLT